MKEDLLKIINTYGVIPQLKYFQSEVFELNEAIIKAENPFEPIQDIEHIAEEISDCLVMIEQFKLYYGITSEEITEVMKYKIHRQLERLNNEKGNKNN